MLEVTLELDTAPRLVEVPEDFQAALDQSPAAKAAFEALSNSKKQGLVLPILNAKTPETRLKRIEKAVATLGG